MSIVWLFNLQEFNSFKIIVLNYNKLVNQYKRKYFLKFIWSVIEVEYFQICYSWILKFQFIKINKVYYNSQMNCSLNFTSL